MSRGTGEGSALREGLAAAWPICLGYLPIGLSLGVLAQKAGLGPLQILLMSVLVFAGGSQFMAVALLGSGASPLAIVSTTFVINLRHLLMSSALALHFPQASRRFLALFAYGITDESFATNMARFRTPGWDRRRALIVNTAANLVWIASSVAGVYVGDLIPSGAFGIDYALTAMFLCLLSFQFRERLHVLTAVVAAALSVTLYLLVPGNLYVIVASCGAATIGLVIKSAQRRAKGAVHV